MTNDAADDKRSDSARNFRELRVWQEAMLVAQDVYDVTQRFPKSEMYGLADQMRRSAVSIPSNIAEGHGRTSSKEFAHFASVARGSAAELQTQIILAQRLSFLAVEPGDSMLARLDGVSKMLWSLQSKLRRQT